jgi:hypothetical protein
MDHFNVAVGHLDRAAPPDGQTCEIIDAAPRPPLRPGVWRYRGFRLDLGRPRRLLKAPADLVSVMIGFGATLRVRHSLGPAAAADSFVSPVTGLRTRAGLCEHDGRLSGIEVTMAPWAAFTLLGRPMPVLTDTVIDLAQLRGQAARDLATALAWIPTWTDRFALLDRGLCEPGGVLGWLLVEVAATHVLNPPSDLFGSPGLRGRVHPGPSDRCAPV